MVALPEPLSLPVYLDNHSTTRVDPRVVAEMLPYFDLVYGNPASQNHSFGSDALDAVDSARESIAFAINAQPDEIVFTSGATESNNLAIKGVAAHVRRRGDHFITAATEHPSVLDPFEKLQHLGKQLTILEVGDASRTDAGVVDVDRVAAVIRDDTALVSLMLVNNEIGTIQPIAEVGKLCRASGVPFHCDATQAVGRIPVDVEQLSVDMMSFSAHKMYGPKGVGALYVRRRGRPVRLRPLFDGGGHERGLRSGTLNTPGIVGFAKALELCLAEGKAEGERLRTLRDRLWNGLLKAVPGVCLNGPVLNKPDLRIAGNLNVSFPNVDGEALILTIRDLAVSSGSACTTVNPQPSHVLRALGLSDEAVRASLRFGLGRFTTEAEIDFAIGAVAEAVRTLQKSSSMV